MNFYKNKLTCPAKFSKFLLPDYLKKGGPESYSAGQVKNLLASVLDGTFDDEREDDMLNRILYELIPAQDKPLFKSKFLKNTRATSMATRTSKHKESINSGLSEIEQGRLGNIGSL